ncbi:helix-hairpin-helix domain-containing protein [Tissierellaceae bacterium HCP3S3_D8]
MRDYFTKKEQMIILIIAFSVVLFVGLKMTINGIIGNREETIDLLIDDEKKEIDDISHEEDEIQDTIIMVHISGQVYNPGIIELELGARVIDAVESAGGLKKDADIDRINLARKLSDEEKIYVPKIGEEDLQGIDIDSQEGATTIDGKININRCSKEELITLPGIGEVIAGRIIEYRDSNRFEKIEDLMNVSGIGAKKFDGLKDLITTD